MGASGQQRAQNLAVSLFQINPVISNNYFTFSFFLEGSHIA